jgi:hypothetical protein
VPACLTTKMIYVILLLRWMTIIIVKLAAATGQPASRGLNTETGGVLMSDNTARAPADLAIEVYTTTGRPFSSAVTPEGPGDLPTWSPSSATLIYGDHDAVLVDTLIT